MNCLYELNQMYLLQLTTLRKAKRLHESLLDKKILDRESNRIFREFLKQGQKELWKSYLCLKKAYEKVEKYNRPGRPNNHRNRLDQ